MKRSTVFINILSLTFTYGIVIKARGANILSEDIGHSPVSHKATSEDMAKVPNDCFAKVSPDFEFKMGEIVTNFNSYKKSGLGNNRAIDAAAKEISTLGTDTNREAATEILAQMNTEDSTGESLSKDAAANFQNQLKKFREQKITNCTLLSPGETNPNNIAAAIKKGPTTLPTKEEPKALAKNGASQPKVSNKDSFSMMAAPAPIRAGSLAPPAKPAPTTADHPLQASAPQPPKKPEQPIVATTPPQQPTNNEQTSDQTSDLGYSPQRTYTPTLPSEMLKKIEEDKNPTPKAAPKTPTPGFWATIGSRIGAFFSGIYKFLFGWIK